MAVLTERLEIIAEEINFLLRENLVSINDLLITPEGNLNALNVNIGYIYYNNSGISKLYYEKNGLQNLMAKVFKRPDC
jgi:hypothetical protein